VITLLPFITGLITGLAIGFVGTSFPLIVPLIYLDSSSPIPYIMLAFFCGYFGVLLSPVHICAILTKDYFKVGYFKMMRNLILPFGFLVVFAGLWFMVLKLLIQ